MRLHLDVEAFKNAILATAQNLNIREVYIEKDYWVTYVLHQLSLSEYKEEIIFKGGTSLSKAYQCIDRFSEDVDLAVIVGDRTKNQIKKLIDNSQKIITSEFEEEEIVGITSKGSKFRKTVHQYKRVLDSGNFGQATDKLIIETSAFTDPNPYHPRTIESYIATYIKSQGLNDLIEQYSLETFEINCLNIERTFAEKIMGLIRMCYDAQPITALQKKIRHLYDLERMLQLDSIQTFIQSDAFFVMIKRIKLDDSRNHEFAGNWMTKPLCNALLFDKIENTWQELESTYLNDFEPLVYGILPSSKSIVMTLNIIKQRLEDYGA